MPLEERINWYIYFVQFAFNGARLAWAACGMNAGRCFELELYV